MIEEPWQISNRINEVLDGVDRVTAIKAVEIVLSQSIGFGDPYERAQVQRTITRLQAELNSDLPNWPSRRRSRNIIVIVLMLSGAAMMLAGGAKLEMIECIKPAIVNAPT